MWVWLRDHPLWLYGICTVLVIPYLVLLFLYPNPAQSEVFYLPALIVGNLDLTLVLLAVGFVMSAIFYTRKTGSQWRGYALFGVTVVWLFAAISLARTQATNDGVIHAHTITFQGDVYHIAYTAEAITCIDENTCIEQVALFQCDENGWFCRTVAPRITIDAATQVYLRIANDDLQVAQLDGTVVHTRRDWVCRLPWVCESR